MTENTTPSADTPGETIRRLTDEEVGKHIEEELPKLFPDSLLLTPDKEGKTLLARILARADPETERKILEGLILLETDQELIALRAKVLPDQATLERMDQKKIESIVHDFVERFEQYRNAGMGFMAFLNNLLIKETKGKAGPAFKDENNAKVEGKFITAYLDEIEGYLEGSPRQRGSPQKNPLFYGDGPHFRNIDRMIENFRNIEQAGIKEDHRDKQLALARVQNLTVALENTKTPDKAGNRFYEMMKNQPPSMLRKPALAAGVVVGTLFATMSGFPALWRWWKEGKAPKQAEILTTALWSSIPLGIAGVFKGDRKGLQRMVQKEAQIMASPAFRETVQKIGTAASLDALEEFHDLLKSKKFAEIKRMAYADSPTLAVAALETLLDTKVEPGKVPASKLLAALSQEGNHALTDSERKEFFRTAFLHLQDRKVESLEELKAILQTEKVMRFA